MWAIQRGHRDCAELLLDRKADPNHQDKVNGVERVGRWRMWWYELTLALCVFDGTIVVLILNLTLTLPLALTLTRTRT